MHMLQGNTQIKTLGKIKISLLDRPCLITQLNLLIQLPYQSLLIFLIKSPQSSLMGGYCLIKKYLQRRLKVETAYKLNFVQRKYLKLLTKSN